MNTPLTRRRLLVQALIGAGLVAAPGLPELLAAPDLLVANVTQLYSVRVARIATPRSADDVAKAIAAWPGRVAVGGGRYSMGGQVAVEGGLHLDMRQMNQLVWLNAPERKVRVQAGMRWRDLQSLIDPQGLAVKTMQSYANFTVGGAVSVNAHVARSLGLRIEDGDILRPGLALLAPGGKQMMVDGRGAVKILRDGYDGQNRPCREYHSVVVLEQMFLHSTGFLCRQPNGAWEVVQSHEYPLYRHGA